MQLLLSTHCHWNPPWVCEKRKLSWLFLLNQSSFNLLLKNTSLKITGNNSFLANPRWSCLATTSAITGSAKILETDAMGLCECTVSAHACFPYICFPCSITKSPTSPESNKATTPFIGESHFLVCSGLFSIIHPNIQNFEDIRTKLIASWNPFCTFFCSCLNCLIHIFSSWLEHRVCIMKHNAIDPSYKGERERGKEEYRGDHQSEDSHNDGHTFHWSYVAP